MYIDTKLKSNTVICESSTMSNTPLASLKYEHLIG